MGRKPISDEQIEIIKATFAETGNLSAAARAAGCSISTASKYTDPVNKDEFEDIRNLKRVDIIDAITEAQIALIGAIKTKATSSDETTRDLATAFGILTDKHQLLTGQATERHEHRNTTEARESIARRIDELAERRRARDVAGESVGAGSA